MSENAHTTVDPREIENFGKVAALWWDPDGPFRPLHQLNPTRLEFIRTRLCAHFGRPLDTIRPLEGLRILDIGCGGGLLSEPLARMGASVTGADATERNIATAAAHAAAMALAIDYRCTTAEALAAAGERFDAVINMEVIEHVADPALFLSACRSLLDSGADSSAAGSRGIMLFSTINRTAESWLKAIVGAEYVLRWLPAGTHDWNRFLKPPELSALLRTARFDPAEFRGMSFSPLTRRWRLSDDLSVNYLGAAVPLSFA